MESYGVNIERSSLDLSVTIKGEFGEIIMCGEIIDGRLIDRGVAPVFYQKDDYLKLEKAIRLKIRDKAIVEFQHFARNLLNT